MKTNPKYQWMKVTNDEYELPIASADTAAELAKLCGVTAANITRQVSQARRGVIRHTCYIRVAI